MALMPGAEPFRHEGGPVGVLVCHGFTGSPQSVRPWAEHLADRGLTVSLPLLPGHGTHWREMNVTRWPDWYGELDREFRLLSETCEQVFVAGLSMGGGLALHLAAQHGSAVSGLVVVNPAVRMPNAFLAALLPVLRHAVPSVAGIIDDIAKPGMKEGGYERTPLHAAHSFAQFCRVVQSELPLVDQPVLLFRSSVDHVVPAASSALVLSRISSADVTERVLERSFHVATLDHDAEMIFEGSAAFIERLTHAAKG
jgi:carboxylesterase